MTLFTLTIPASTANLGPGFDSMGMALNTYLTLKVYTHDHWVFEHHSACLPKDTAYDTHFIYLVAKQVAQKHNKTLPPCRVVVTSDIPLARGLGSSASAVVAGVELANQLCKLNLSDDEKLLLATDFEGHPDNVAPALFGGLTVATSFDNKISYFKINTLTVDLILYIPDVKLSTTDSRNVLPSTLSLQDAARASSISNVMVGALLTQDYTLAGEMMESDIFHEPYRAKLIPEYENIKAQAKQLGAYATVLSGAGPTMISLVPHGQGEQMAKQMQPLFPSHHVKVSQIDQSGVQID